MALFDITPDRGAVEVKAPSVAPVLSRAEMTLAAAFPEIRPGFDYPFVTGGSWNIHDLVTYLIKITGPADLVMATWSVSQKGIDRLITLRKSGQIRSLRMLVDWMVQTTHPGLIAIAKTYGDKLVVEDIHAKAFVLQNSAWAISYVGSSNLTTHRKIEAGHLSTSPAVAAFHAGWINSSIDGGKPFGLRNFSNRQDQAEIMLEGGEADD